MDFHCKECNFSTKNKYDWNKHILTNKHKFKVLKKSNTDLHNEKEKKNKKVFKNFQCKKCNKSYRYSSGLSRHEKTCLFNNDNENEEINQIKNQQEQILNLHSLLEKTIEHNNILTSKIEAKNVTNINNNLTINLFLNEECKDAMNIKDFIDKLNLSLDDLNYTRDNGYIKGITNIILKNLSIIPPMNRPFHCSDIKKLQFYVKDEDKWEKDTQNEKIDKSIKDITRRQINKIKEWENNHPNWDKTDDGTTQYIKMVRNVMGGINESDSSKNLEIIKKEIGENINQ